MKPYRQQGLAAWTVATLLLVGVTGCENAGSTLGFGSFQTGTIAVAVYVDRDGTKTPTTFDTVAAQIKLDLKPAAGGGALRTGTADAQGLVRFERVPVGEYAGSVVSSALGDSLRVGAGDSTVVTLAPADTVAEVIVRLEYPEISVRAARALVPGRRVFLRGILLSTIQTFRDTTVHLADSSGFIRLTRAGFLGSTTGNNAGDSVTVIGTTGTRAGQPVADIARIVRLALRPPPIPIPVSSGVAATANVGVLDAALVQVTAALISDSATVSPDFRVRASDGSGTVDVIIDGTINVNRTVFVPGRSMNVRGVLVPNGTGAWSIKPRDASDIQLN